jgi:hypothetical protein
MIDQSAMTEEIGRNESPLVPVCHAACVQDRAFFSTLPPMMLHDDYHVSANKLYGGTEASKIAGAAYRAGPFNEVPANNRNYHGGAVFDLNGRTYPVVIYSTRNTFRNGEMAVIAHVYNAPLSELEADLFDDRKPISNVERKWLGDECATTQRRNLMHMHAVMREGGLGTMPGFLLDGDYHLVRGALPWLHFREPRTEHETTMLDDALVAALAYDENHAQAEEPGQVVRFDLKETPSGVLGKEDDDCYNLMTVFDRCEQQYAWVPKKVNAESVEQTPSWRPFWDNMRHVRGMLSKPDDCRMLMLGIAMQLLNEHGNGDYETPAMTNLRFMDDYSAVEREEASEMMMDAPPFTLHTLTAMVRTVGILSPTRVGNATFAPNSLEKIAAATFAASDAVLAFRDVDGWVHKSRDESRHEPVEWCARMAQRINEKCAMLLLEVDAGFAIKSMELVNSAIRCAVKHMTDVARLIACPWVTVVMYRSGPGAASEWYTLDASLVQRDLLQVTDKVRETFGAAPARPPRPAATPESVEQLRKYMTERLDKLEKSVGEVKTIRQAAPPAPRAAEAATSAPVESETVSTLRMAYTELQRLIGKRQRVSASER